MDDIIVVNAKYCKVCIIHILVRWVFKVNEATLFFVWQKKISPIKDDRAKPTKQTTQQPIV